MLNAGAIEIFFLICSSPFYYYALSFFKKIKKDSLQFLPTFHGIIMLYGWCYARYKFQKNNQILIHM